MNLHSKTPSTLVLAAAVLLSASVSAGLALRDPAPKESPSVVLTPRKEWGRWLPIHADSYWLPTDRDIRALEERLRGRVPTDGERLPSGLLDYYRQYIGIVVGRRRLIYVNGFSKGVVSEFTGGARDWHGNPVFVDDGGNSFFHVTYDPKDQRFHAFSFNGEA